MMSYLHVLLRCPRGVAGRVQWPCWGENNKRCFVPLWVCEDDCPARCSAKQLYHSYRQEAWYGEGGREDAHGNEW